MKRWRWEMLKIALKPLPKNTGGMTETELTLKGKR